MINPRERNKLLQGNIGIIQLWELREVFLSEKLARLEGRMEIKEVDCIKDHRGRTNSETHSLSSIGKASRSHVYMNTIGRGKLFSLVK